MPRPCGSGATPSSSFSLSALGEAISAGSANRPSDRLNGFRVFDADESTFDVDVAELVLQLPVSKPGETGSPRLLA